MLSVQGRDIAGLRCPTERATLCNVIYCVVSQSRISWASCREALDVHFPQLKMRTYIKHSSIAVWSAEFCSGNSLLSPTTIEVSIPDCRLFCRCLRRSFMAPTSATVAFAFDWRAKIVVNAMMFVFVLKISSTFLWSRCLTSAASNNWSFSVQIQRNMQ